MASGCTSNSSSSFLGCLTPTQDKCVKYTGPAVPFFNICPGDTLYEIDSIILSNLQNFATGIGINVTGIDYGTCDLFTTYITCCNSSADVPKSLKDLLQVIFDTLCALDGRVTVLETFINDLKAGPYPTSCLSGISASSTFKDIIIAMINKICNLDSRVTTLETTVASLESGLGNTIGNFLAAHINSCQGPDVLKKTGSGSTTNLQIAGACPIGTVIAYDGDLSLFDSTGLGRIGTSACGWALCNGANGTRNMNGVTVMGVTTMGGATNPVAGGASYSHGATGGTPAVTLAVTNIPSMPVSGTIPAITGSAYIGDQIGFKTSTSGNNALSYPAGIYGGPAAPHNAVYATFSTPLTSFTATTGGSATPVENRPPYIALEWIKRVS